MTRLALGSIVASLFLVASPVWAQTQVAIQAGFVNNTFNSRNTIAANANIITGRFDSADYRSFVTFAIPASINDYTSAQFQLNASAVVDGPNTLEIYDVNTNIATDPVATVYADLGSGTSFGTITGLNNNDPVVLSLNAAGLASINAAKGSTITLGLNNATIGAPVNDYIFGLSTNSVPRNLVLSTAAPVPTLSEWALIIFGLTLAGCAALHLQRRRMTV